MLRAKARHDGLDAGPDRVAVQRTEDRMPLLERQRIDGGQQVLIARIEALARPVLDRRSHAEGLDDVDVQGAELPHPVRARTERARTHDRAAEIGVDVDDGREGPVDADRAGLVHHHRKRTPVHFNVGQRGHRQLVGHGRRTVQADGPAFDVATDEHGDVRCVLDAAGHSHRGFQTPERELGEGPGLQPAQDLALPLVLRTQHDVEQLRQSA
jgi:hypothetical protein